MNQKKWSSGGAKLRVAAGLCVPSNASCPFRPLVSGVLCSTLSSSFGHCFRLCIATGSGRTGHIGQTDALQNRQTLYKHDKEPTISRHDAHEKAGECLGNNPPSSPPTSSSILTRHQLIDRPCVLGQVDQIHLVGFHHDECEVFLALL